VRLRERGERNEKERGMRAADLESLAGRLKTAKDAMQIADARKLKSELDTLAASPCDPGYEEACRQIGIDSAGALLALEHSPLDVKEAKPSDQRPEIVFKAKPQNAVKQQPAGTGAGASGGSGNGSGGGGGGQPVLDIKGECGPAPVRPELPSAPPNPTLKITQVQCSRSQLLSAL
jgi:hypothetical protein